MAYDYRQWLLRVQERSEGVYDALDRANLRASTKNLELNCSELKESTTHAGVNKNCPSVSSTLIKVQTIQLKQDECQLMTFFHCSQKEF